MARIYISRDSSFMGMAGVLHCYVNDTLVAQIKNGADATYDTDADVVEFRCHIPSGPLSDVYTIRLTGKKMITITVKIGATKPQVTVLDSGVILSIKSVNGTDGSRMVIKNGVPTMFSSDDPKNKAFNPNKTVGKYFAMDDNSKLWAISQGPLTTWKNGEPRSYSDIIDFELIEDGGSISKGGLGRAIVGGALYGGVGAIVGGVTGKKKSNPTCTSLMIKITINNSSHPTQYIKFITSSTKKSSFTYKTEFNNAQEIMSLLQLIVNKQKEHPAMTQQSTIVINQPTSPIDEIRKYKALMDEGIISKEEFEEKKRQLLGL